MLWFRNSGRGKLDDSSSSRGGIHLRGGLMWRVQSSFAYLSCPSVGWLEGWAQQDFYQNVYIWPC